MNSKSKSHSFRAQSAFLVYNDKKYAIVGTVTVSGGGAGMHLFTKRNTSRSITGKFPIYVYEQTDFNLFNFTFHFYLFISPFFLFLLKQTIFKSIFTLSSHQVQLIDLLNKKKYLLLSFYLINLYVCLDVKSIDQKILITEFIIYHFVTLTHLTSTHLISTQRDGFKLVDIFFYNNYSRIRSN